MKKFICVLPTKWDNKAKKSISSIMNTKIIEPIELLHIDICGSSSIKSIGGNKYILVVIDVFHDLLGCSFLNKSQRQ